MNKKLLLLMLSNKQPRRLKLIKNLLDGKKTVSTLFWGSRYHMLDYSGIMKHFDSIKNEDKIINELIKYGYVFPYDKYQYKLTNKGKTKKDSLIESFYLPKELSYGFDYDIEEFKSRFLLLIQVASEYSYNNSSYYPVQADFYDTNLIKAFFHKHKNDNFVDKIYNIINSFLATLDKERASIFANLMIGHDNYGLTYEQLSKQYNYSQLEIYFINIDLWILLIRFIKNNSSFLKILLKNIVKNKINESAKRTFNELNSGLKISSIAKKYNLKESTIKEHLLENAIFLSATEFPYNKLLSTANISYLNKTYLQQPIDLWKFSKLNDSNIDFFKFRLYQIMRSK
ncbi:helix-turn-helix domain-containing protein [Apilactobacillus quenuiae]|uniref:helix-turn-helix domain-containing protein n=1 Tax=Apilactobacillus quenuiae TaxID=2008377 RepID=UPI000D01865B|nr:helix-turn-helix domain-containing protein [Apilactobacillus quenuiae]